MQNAKKGIFRIALYLMSKKRQTLFTLYNNKATMITKTSALILVSRFLYKVLHSSSVESQMTLTLYKDGPLSMLRTKRALSIYKVYGDNAFLVLNGTSLNSVNAILALSRRYLLIIFFIFKHHQNSSHGKDVHLAFLRLYMKSS